MGKYNFLKKGIAQTFRADGNEGLPDFSPFDKILVSAAAEKVPSKLLEQLAIGGRLVIPVGERYGTQDMMVIDKIGKNEFKEEKYPGFVFVPLVKGT